MLIGTTEVPDIQLSLPRIISLSAEAAKKVRQRRDAETIYFCILQDHYDIGNLADFLHPDSGASPDARITRAVRFLELIFNSEKEAEALEAFRGTELEAMIRPELPEPARPAESLAAVQRPLRERSHCFIFEELPNEANVSSVCDGSEIFSASGNSVMIRKYLDQLREDLFPDMPSLCKWDDMGQGLRNEDADSRRWIFPAGPRSIKAAEDLRKKIL